MSFYCSFRTFTGRKSKSFYKIFSHFGSSIYSEQSLLSLNLETFFVSIHIDRKMPYNSKKKIAGFRNYHSQRPGKRPREGSSTSNHNSSVFLDQRSVDVGCQTEFLGPGERLSSVHKNFTMKEAADLIAIFVDMNPGYSSIHRRVLSVFVYLLLRLFNIQYEQVRVCLQELGLSDVSRCHVWPETIAEEKDSTVVLKDKRGQRQYNNFYDSYPELEEIVKLFVLDGLKQKNCSFDCGQLAKFVDKEFRSIYATDVKLQNFPDNQLVRSVESCRVDLLRWGAVWDKNKSRPYFEGHERDDNIQHRMEFCQRFSDSKDFYFYPLQQGQRLNHPIRRPTILLAHDESTFRSGDVQYCRWFLPGHEPFHNKGRGRSIMVSDFLVQFDEPLFELSQEEYDLALQRYPELDEPDEFLNFFPRSASAWIHPQKDCYFNNSTILKQFERLFKLSQFKRAYQEKQLEVLVDNATTHSAKLYDVSNFSKKCGTFCPYEVIEWIENGNKLSVQCKDSNGVYVGLLKILKEIKLVQNDAREQQFKLQEMRELLSNHVAFEPISKLESLAREYGITIVFCPKYHCELNPIEGLWCEQKRVVRK